MSRSVRFYKTTIASASEFVEGGARRNPTMRHRPSPAMPSPRRRYPLKEEKAEMDGASGRGAGGGEESDEGGGTKNLQQLRAIVARMAVREEELRAELARQLSLQGEKAHRMALQRESEELERQRVAFGKERAQAMAALKRVQLELGGAEARLAEAEQALAAKDKKLEMDSKRRQEKE